MKQQEELLLNDYYTVAIIFNVGDTKTYTYKVDKSIKVEEEDFVVVLANGKYAVVQVQEVHEEANIDFDSHIEYKYIIDRIDFTKFRELQERSKLIKKTLAESKRRALKTTLVDQFKDGLDEEGQKQLGAWL